MNFFAKLIFPTAVFGRMKFFLMFIASVVTAFGVFIAFDGYGIIESDAVFTLCTFIPTYLLYYGFVCRYNDIGRFQKAVYLFLGIFLMAQVSLAFEINIEEDTVLYMIMVEMANIVFGVILLLFGLFKKGKLVLQDMIVYLPDHIGNLKKENLSEVKTSHKPDFSTHGLVLVYNDKQRVILSSIDQDMLQPDTLRGARLFEFSLAAVKTA